MKIPFTNLLFLLTVFSASAQTDNSYNLVPQPSSLARNGERFSISDKFRVAVTGNPDPRIYAEASRFIRRMGEKTGYFLDRQGYVSANDTSASASLLIRIKRPGKLMLNENESYILEISAAQVVVTAETDLGAIHALETLMQLVSADEKGYYFPVCNW